MHETTFVNGRGVAHKGSGSVSTVFPCEDAEVDGKRVFEAKEEIVFKCGESSITLTKSGKI